MSKLKICAINYVLIGSLSGIETKVNGLEYCQI